MSLIEKVLSVIIPGQENGSHSLLEAAVRFMYSLIKFVLCKAARSVNGSSPDRDIEIEVI
jgi:hypothetical protein